MAPKFEDMSMVAIEQGGTAEAALDGIDGAIDSMTNTQVVLVADLFSEGEMAVEH